MMRVALAVVFRFAVCVAVPLAALLSSDASAQTPAPRAQEPPPTAPPATPPRAGVRDENADLSITARVTAESLRFEKVPNTRVEFTGKPARETVWEAERENLPQQVQPGVTYRNIGITLRITSVFADIDRIVAEALGEVPINDEARPTPARPSPTTPAQPAPATPAQPSPPSNERPAAAPPAASADAPANSGATAPRRRPARRGRGK